MEIVRLTKPTHSKSSMQFEHTPSISDRPLTPTRTRALTEFRQHTAATYSSTLDRLLTRTHESTARRSRGREGRASRIGMFAVTICWHWAGGAQRLTTAGSRRYSHRVDNLSPKILEFKRSGRTVTNARLAKGAHGRGVYLTNSGIVRPAERA